MAEKRNRLAQDIEFADGVTRTVRPLKISQLRKFSKVAQSLTEGVEGKTNLEEEDIDRMMDAAQIIMEGIDSEVAKDRERLEEAFDVEIFWAVFSVAMGTRLEDNPNV